MLPPRCSALAAIISLALLAACSVPNPLAGAAIEGSTHGGWGAPRATPSQATSQPPSEGARPTDESIASAPHEDPATRPTSREARPTPRKESPPPRRSETVAEATAPSRAMSERIREPEPAPSERAVDAPPAVPETPERVASPVITRVSFAERSDGRGLVVRLHSSAPIPAHKIEAVGEDRLQLTLFHTDIGSDARRDDPRGGVRAYQVTREGTQTLVTFDVQAGVFYERQPYPDRDSNDLLVSLIDAPPRPTVIAAATNGSNGGDDASREHWRLDCIVIDAGHGGRDPGAVANGVRESDVNLGIALKLGRLVEDNLGVRVVYTRRDDRFVELAERGRIANQSCGKLFVSIHANSAANRNAQGSETYFLGVSRSESARRVMERENAVIALESDPSLYSGMDETALIMHTLAQSTYLRASEQLAGLIEQRFTTSANRNSRGVKQAGFLVLWRASMPAVLVETGFITNPLEARFLASQQGQHHMAQAIYQAIREFKQQYDRGLGIAVN